MAYLPLLTPNIRLVLRVYSGVAIFTWPLVISQSAWSKSLARFISITVDN